MISTSSTVQMRRLVLFGSLLLFPLFTARGQSLAQPTFKDIEPPAPQFEVEGLVGQVDAALEAANYYFPPHRTEVSKLTMRTLLTKPGWSSREVRALRGMLRSIAKGKKR